MCLWGGSRNRNRRPWSDHETAAKSRELPTPYLRVPLAPPTQHQPLPKHTRPLQSLSPCRPGPLRSPTSKQRRTNVEERGGGKLLHTYRWEFPRWYTYRAHHLKALVHTNTHKSLWCVALTFHKHHMMREYSETYIEIYSTLWLWIYYGPVCDIFQCDFLSLSWQISPFRVIGTDFSLSKYL